MYIFTISKHPMTGPLFEPSVIQTIYEQLPAKDKPKIVDANCKFIMNDLSLNKYVKNVQNPHVVYLNKSDNLISVRYACFVFCMITFTN